MDLFGKKALEAQLEAMSDENEQLKADLAAARRRTEDAKKALDALTEEKKELLSRIENLEAGIEKARDAQRKAEQMAHWLEERHQQATQALDKIRKERDEALERLNEALSLQASLQRELDEVRSQAQRPVRKEPAPESKESADPDLLAQIDALKKALAETQERLKVALRKAEHNRRAYIVTLHQLDMAEDRIHMLTKGTPRPVLVNRGDVDGGPVEAEEVEGFSNEGPDEPTASGGE